MPLNKVTRYLKDFGKENDIRLFQCSTATVELAAEALGVIPARIAKSIALLNGEDVIILVTAGDVKIDNRKYKDTFGVKAKMLSHELTPEKTGFPVGGVCPFISNGSIKVYIDISVKRFDTVFPACGTPNSAIGLTPDELFTISRCAGWVDIAKAKDE